MDYAENQMPGSILGGMASAKSAAQAQREPDMVRVLHQTAQINDGIAAAVKSVEAFLDRASGGGLDTESAGAPREIFSGGIVGNVQSSLADACERLERLNNLARRLDRIA